MLLALSASTLLPANSRNHTASHARERTDSCSSRQAGSNGLLRAAGGGALEQRQRRRRGREEDRGCGAEKHRTAPTRTPIRISSSRCVPSGHRVPASASSYVPAELHWHTASRTGTAPPVAAVLRRPGRSRCAVSGCRAAAVPARPNCTVCTGSAPLPRPQ